MWLYGFTLILDVKDTRRLVPCDSAVRQTWRHWGNISLSKDTISRQLQLIFYLGIRGAVTMP